MALIIGLILLYCFCWKSSQEEEHSQEDHKKSSTPKKLQSNHSENGIAPPSPSKDDIAKEQQSDTKSEKTKFVTLKPEGNEQSSEEKSEETKFITLKNEGNEQGSEDKSDETKFVTVKSEPQKEGFDLPVTANVESEQLPLLSSTHEATVVDNYNTSMLVQAAPDLLDNSTTSAQVNQPAPPAEAVTPPFETAFTNQTESPASIGAPFASALLANEDPLTAISVDDFSTSDAVAVSTSIPTSNVSQAEKSDSGTKSELVQESEVEKTISYKTQKLSDPVEKLDNSKSSNPPKTVEKLNMSSENEKKTLDSVIGSTSKWNTSVFSGDQLAIYSLAEPQKIVEKSISEKYRKNSSVYKSTIDSLKTDMAKWGKDPVKKPILTILTPSKAKTNQSAKGVVLIPPSGKQQEVKQKSGAILPVQKESMAKVDSPLSSVDDRELTAVDSGISLLSSLISSITSVPSSQPQ